MMKKISLAILGIAMLSCKNDESVNEFKKCGFEVSTDILPLNNQQGELHYSKSINGILVDDYTYYIKVDGQLPLSICNMPESMNIPKDSRASVTFSGRMEVLSAEADAISTRLELTELHIE